MSHPLGPGPLPTPETLESIASTPGSTVPGSRWRTAAFLADLGALLLVLVAWVEFRPGLAPTALVAGGAASLVCAVALVRSWSTSARVAAVVWAVLALAVLVLGAVLRS